MFTENNSDVDIVKALTINTEINQMFFNRPIVIILRGVAPASAHELKRLRTYMNPKQICKYTFCKAENTLSIYAELVIRAFICAAYNVCNKDLVFSFSPHGKPYWAENSEFHFNLSHSGNMIAIALSNVPVGIDIEGIDCPDLRVAKRFFSKDEQEYVFSKAQERVQRFYEIWTKKEAYTKYLGMGLSYPFNSFNVLEQTHHPNFICCKLSNFQISCYSMWLQAPVWVVSDYMKIISIAKEIIKYN